MVSQSHGYNHSRSDQDGRAAAAAAFPADTHRQKSQQTDTDRPPPSIFRAQCVSPTTQEKSSGGIQVAQGDSPGPSGTFGLYNAEAMIDVNSPKHQTMGINPTNLLLSMRTTEQEEILPFRSSSYDQSSSNLTSLSILGGAIGIPTENTSQHADGMSDPEVPVMPQNHGGHVDLGGNVDGEHESSPFTNCFQPVQEYCYAFIPCSAYGYGSRPKVTLPIRYKPKTGNDPDVYYSRIPVTLANLLRPILLDIPDQKGSLSINAKTGIESQVYIIIYAYLDDGSRIKLSIQVVPDPEGEEAGSEALYFDVRGRAAEKLGLGELFLQHPLEPVGVPVNSGGNSPGQDSMDSMKPQVPQSIADIPFGDQMGDGENGRRAMATVNVAHLRLPPPAPPPHPQQQQATSLAISTQDAPTNFGSGTSMGLATGIGSNFTFGIYSADSSATGDDLYLADQEDP